MAKILQCRECPKISSFIFEKNMFNFFCTKNKEHEYKDKLFLDFFKDSIVLNIF